MATKWNLEKHSVRCNQICIQIRKVEPGKNIHRLIINCSQKRGDITGHDGFKRITGTKIHVAVDNNGLPVSIIIGPANEHIQIQSVLWNHHPNNQRCFPLHR